VVPSGVYVCNKRKNNTTHNLRALVHRVYDISKDDIFRTTVLEAAIDNAQFTLYTLSVIRLKILRTGVDTHYN